MSRTKNKISRSFYSRKSLLILIPKYLNPKKAFRAIKVPFCSLGSLLINYQKEDTHMEDISIN